ncbi:MAG: hypothetical protein KDD36_03170 [Flavobacteriales bacterium]|nr:hypothetical protein [Flavobacteriales bacterium]
MKTVLLYIALLGTVVANAQINPFPEDRYSFIQYGTNTIETFGNRPFDNLFRKMDSIYFYGSGQVNIVHIGGSHIQADIWSGRLRERLQESAPGCNAGRGLVFPYSIARTNNPWNYKSKYRGNWSTCRNVQRSKECLLGVSGIQATTSDTQATFTIIPKDKVGDTRYPAYDFNRIKVFSNADSASYRLVPADTSLQYEMTHDPASGAWCFTFSSFHDTLDMKVVRTDSLNRPLTLFGVVMETDDPGYYYHAIGVNGASVPSYLRCKLFTDQLAVLKPDLVILSIGINDAYESDFVPSTYETNYDSLVAMIRMAAPHCAILFTTNNDSYRRRRNVNRNGLLVKDAMDRLARKHHGAVWDLFSVMGGLDVITEWEKNGLARKDKVHFSREGYLLVGDLMYEAVMKAYDEHLSTHD